MLLESGCGTSVDPSTLAADQTTSVFSQVARCGVLGAASGTNEVRGILDQVRGILDQVRGILDQMRGILDQVRGSPRDARSRNNVTIRRWNSQPREFQEVWDSCAQNKTSEIPHA